MTATPQVEHFLFAGAVGAFTLLLVLEKLRPGRRVSTACLKKSFSTNTSAFLFNNIVMNALSMSSLLLVAQNYAHFGLLSQLHDGPAKWALSFIIFDFAVYAWHWLGHKSEQLWRFHKIHHSDKTVHVTTGLRFHVFDQFLEVIVKCVCAVVIGVEAHVVVVCEVTRMFFVLFHHANIRIPGEKWLSYLIITPSLHRVHHSSRRIEHDSNYGIVLAVWDLIFGTRKELTPKKIGLELIEADNLLQLFSLAFLTEHKLARVLHLMPRNDRRPRY